MNSNIYNIKKSIINIMLYINKKRHLYLLNKYTASTDEEKEAVKYIKENNIDTFTNRLSKIYKPSDVKVFSDSKNGLNFVYWNLKKLYLPKGMCIKQIQDYISFLSAEQDIYSPHSYSIVDIPSNSIVIDIGAAEGNFSLDLVDKVSKLYIVESNSKWLESLRETFSPYKDKVVIINETITKNNPIDNYIKDIPDYVKIDAEGAEKDIIISSQIIINHKPTIVAATYHNGEDAKDLEKILRDNSFDTKFSKGLLMFLYKFSTSYPILRKALIVATKN